MPFPLNDTALAGLCSASRAYKVNVFSLKPKKDGNQGVRRKLSAEKRAKVHGVRRTGACLSCRMLKVPCDIPDPRNPGPCKRCLAIASRPHQKGLLAFRECIRTKIRDVNIFQHTLDVDFTSLYSPKLISLISKTVDPVQSGASSSLSDVVSSIFNWMVKENEASREKSIVGALLCSNQFRQLAKGGGLLGEELLEKFRAMVYASTLAYVYDSGSREVYDSDLSIQDLHRITYGMGSDMLLYLDNVLAPHHLAKLSHEHLCGLFVVIFGIALAVAYTTSVYDSPSFNHSGETPGFYGQGSTPKTLWQALQQHLSQMLAHHLVILGSRLGLVLRGDSEREVLSSLMDGIIRRGNFVWVAEQRAVSPPSTTLLRGLSPSASEPSNSTSSDTTNQTAASTEELFVLNIPETDNQADPTTGALSVSQLDSYRSAPISARNLQTVQNTLRLVTPGARDCRFAQSARQYLYAQSLTPPPQAPDVYACFNIEPYPCVNGYSPSFSNSSSSIYPPYNSSPPPPEPIYCQQFYTSSNRYRDNPSPFQAPTQTEKESSVTHDNDAWAESRRRMFYCSNVRASAKYRQLHPREPKYQQKAPSPTTDLSFPPLDSTGSPSSPGHMQSPEKQEPRLFPPKPKQGRWEGTRQQTPSRPVPIPLPSAPSLPRQNNLPAWDSAQPISTETITGYPPVIPPSQEQQPTNTAPFTYTPTPTPGTGYYIPSVNINSTDPLMGNFEWQPEATDIGLSLDLGSSAHDFDWETSMDDVGLGSQDVDIFEFVNMPVDNEPIPSLAAGSGGGAGGEGDCDSDSDSASSSGMGNKNNYFGPVMKRAVI